MFAGIWDKIHLGDFLSREFFVLMVIFLGVAVTSIYIMLKEVSKQNKKSEEIKRKIRIAPKKTWRDF